MTSTNRPLVGRGPHLDRISRALHGRAARGLVIAGPPGSGRTRLAAEIRSPWRITGTRCASARPYAAFGGRPPARPASQVLVVDDAHLLDDASAALIHQYALQRRVRLVATVVDGAPAPDAVTALWKDDLLARLPLDPLTEPELAELLAAALDGPIERRTVRRLAAMVSGDLRMLAEIVRAGALVRRSGVWTWHGLSSVDGRIRELLAARLGDLPQAAWDALTCAAFAGSLPLGALASVAGPAAVELLEARGLVAPAGAVPYAEVIRALTGTLRACRIRRQLAELTTDPLRSVMWRLECGDPVEAGPLVAAARAALAADEVPLALRLGRTAKSAGGGVAAAEVIAAAARHARRLEAETMRLDAALAAADLTAAPVLGADTGWDEAAAAYCGHQARLARLRGRPRTALAWARDGVLRQATPLCLGELAHAAALVGDLGTARQALDSLDTDPTQATPIHHGPELGERPGFPASGPMLTGVEAGRVAWGCSRAASVGLARAQLLEASGDRAGAVAAALEIRGAGRVYGLHAAVRLGCPEPVADELERTPGAFAALAARQAAALIAGDGAALEVVAKEFEHLGYLLYAAEAYAQAAVEHTRTGEPRRARAAIHHGWRLGGDCEGATTLALTALAAPDLTPRQREIARLAASGLGNREIADRLTVSIRTVANHLCAVYDRLGVHDREGLAVLFAGHRTEEEP